MKTILVEVPNDVQLHMVYSYPRGEIKKIFANAKEASEVFIQNDITWNGEKHPFSRYNMPVRLYSVEEAKQ